MYRCGKCFVFVAKEGMDCERKSLGVLLEIAEEVTGVAKESIAGDVKTLDAAGYV